MAQTTKYHISYLDEDNQSVYDLTSDIPKYDKQQALSIEAALESIDLTEAVGDLDNLETTVKSSIVAAINELKGDEANVGSLGDLETTVKTSVVAAINEINGKADDIGDLTDLETTIKTSIVAAINELKGNITTLQNNDATFATAINMKISNTEKGSNNGVAQLDSNGKVPSSQLPSYVDDIIEGYYYEGKFYTDSAHTTEITGEEGKIYVDLVTNKTYRWSSTIFVEISESLALGETSSTAYRGDKGKEAYDRGIQNKKDIDELGNILYTKKELTSTNSKISFTGNENLEFSITEIDGKAEQDTTTGKNKLENKATTSTQGGITFTINEDKSVKVNGTLSSASEYFPLNASQPIQPSTEYILNGAGGPSCRLRIREYDSNNTNLSEYFDQGSGVTFTSKSNVDHVNVQIVVYGNQTNVMVYPMLRLASITDDTYEKYTGGIASPNLDYKQDVKVVTGEQELVVRGKNLLDKTQVIGNNTATTVTQINAGFRVSAETLGYAGVITIDVKANTNYFLKFNTNVIVDSGAQKYVRIFAGTTQTTTIATYTFTEGGGTFNTGNNTKINIWFYCSLGGSGTVDYTNVQLEEGLTASPYEPYITPITKQLSLGEYEFAKIGNYVDTIKYDVENDKVYKNENIEKNTLTSSMCTSVTASASYGTLCYLNFLGKNDDTNICAMSDKFIGVSYEDRTSIPTGYRIFTASGSGAVTIRFPNTSDIDTLQEVKDFVDNNEIITYSVKQTPTKIEITGTLADQIKALYRLQQKMGTTIVEILGDLSPEFKIVYETDTISYIKDNFVKNTDYATSSVGGVIKVVSAYNYNISNSNGGIYPTLNTYAQYSNLTDYAFIGKGTLENVLNARIGDIDTMLDQMNREVV